MKFTCTSAVFSKSLSCFLSSVCVVFFLNQSNCQLKSVLMETSKQAGYINLPPVDIFELNLKLFHFNKTTKFDRNRLLMVVVPPPSVRWVMAPRCLFKRRTVCRIRRKGKRRITLIYSIKSKIPIG